MTCTKLVSAVLLAICGLAFIGGSVEAGQKSAKPLVDEFAQPGREFRGAPFWSWNGDLKQDELQRQVDVLKTMGMGGFFMHSRTGLVTEYLSDEWFRLINACADYAEKKGMDAWLYDEDRWPSGTTGGLVTKNPRFQLKYLSLHIMPAEQFQWSDGLVAAYATDWKDDQFSECVRLKPDTPAADYAGKTILAYDVEAMQSSSFYNGYTYADTLNREATDYFLQTTHEQYKKHCGDRLGKSIQGIFTDEPHRGALFTAFGVDNPNNRYMIPWTYDVPEVFQKRFGYDLLDHLPELYFRKNGEPVAQVKWHFVELLQSMFLDNWAKPIHAWCKANHLEFTGHVLHEDNLTSQTSMQGSLMRFYECMDLPGIDVLTEGNRNYWVVKQLASVARQMGQRRMLSEMYGCTGWQFNFESHKFVGDWQALFGINLRCHHLSWYTMAGEAKRDYPASIFYQSAWWKDYSFIEDYYARIGLMLAQGEPVCDVMIVNPVESVWCQVGVGWASGLSPTFKEVQQLEEAYFTVFQWLIGSHIDFDYGDEEMLSRLSKIEHDAAGVPLFCVGKARYRTVVMPKMTTVRSSTLKLLDEFRKAGGRVVVLGQPPEFVDAVKSPAASELAAKCRQVAFEKDALLAACRESLRIPVEISDASGKPLDQVLCQMRNDGRQLTLVAMSMDRSKAYENVNIRIKSSGHVAEWDCVNGKRFSVDSKDSDGWTEWTADFAPIGQHVFVVSKQKESGLPKRPVYQEIRQETVAGPFAYELDEPNVCVLDLATYRIDDAAWQPETEVLKIDRAVRKHFDIPLRGGQMVQPWFRNKYGEKSQPKGKLTMRFSFFVDQLPQESVKLALEQPADFKIEVNGKPFSAENVNGWWVDPAIKTITVPTDCLVQGENIVELSTDFRDTMNIESLYLVGSFGVQVEGSKKTLTRLPEKLLPSDVVTQGLPFYSGRIVYHIPVSLKPKKGEHLFIETPKFEAACFHAKPAGNGSDVIAWQPYEAEVAPTAETIDLETVLTRRNSFGPLHLVPKNSWLYAPDHWITEGDAWSQDYQLFPAGLLQPPVISIRETK